MAGDDLKPRFAIRRFDVFADYNRVKNEEEGMPVAKAKGRGVWLAKVVAGRRGGAASSRQPAGEHKEGQERKEPEEEFFSVGGVPQTDRIFDKEIVDRMGEEFYERVFHPAIVHAFKEGKRYDQIRDTIRKDWK
jgi:hypothetical protein